METTKPVNFTIEITRAQIRAALIFSAKNDIRYYLNGVCLHVGECGDARLVACDGHRLAVLKLCDESSATPGEYIIPGEPLKAIKKAGRFDVPLSLTIENDNFRFVDPSDNSILCGAKLIEGKFPDYQRVVPLPENMSGAPGTFNAKYLSDIQKALIELGDKNGFFSMLQNGPDCSCLVINRFYGLLAVVMPFRADSVAEAGEVAQFMPRAKPRAIIETATGGEAFPCEPLQDVTDKRTPEPETVQTSGEQIDAGESMQTSGEQIAADIAARFDPSGTLQQSGRFVVMHISDNKPSAPPAAEPEPVPDAEFLAYLASLENHAIAA